jgi:DNA polymerase IV
MSAPIMHLDMDAFFAAVEQQVNPSLRGKPVIVGGRNNKYRAVVVAASYEAKALGISSAMPSWEALRICPQAVFVPADTAKYLYTSEGIFDIMKNFTSRVEQFSIDEFFLDTSGCMELWGSPHAMGQKIKGEIKKRFGLTCSVGVAPTKTAAKLAAKLGKPDGLTVLSKEEALKVMKDLPVEKICGIGGRLKRRFHHLGIETCGQLAVFPEEILKSQFGVMGLWLRSACRVEDSATIGCYLGAPDPPKSVGHSQTLRATTDNWDYIATWIFLLSEMVSCRLRRLRLQGRTVHLYLSDGFLGGFAKQKTFSQATYDGYEIYQRCLHIAKLMGLSSWQVRVLGVSVAQLVPADPHYLFSAQRRRESLLHQLDAINDKYGEWTIYPAQLTQSRQTPLRWPSLKKRYD